ncbi:MAG TPA: glycosyltransferase family 87 protein [Patescibacteria group bacterium]|nr:glycosyltransferase family 87 protein [Patescibacteria group bacterium]
MSAARWRRRGAIAMLAIAIGFVIYPLVENNDDVINSDWPAFATGARILLTDPGHLYDTDTQRRVQFDVTGGKTLITLGINGILPFVTPAWVALIAVPFDLLGTVLGGRLWILFGLACLLAGIWLAVRPRPPSAVLPAFASVPTALLLLNAQLDGLVALGLGAAVALWSRPYLAGVALGLTLMKPQLALPLGAAVLLFRQWKVLAGWAAAGAVLWAVPSLLNPRWVLDWLHALSGPVQPGSREVDLPHFGTLFPDAMREPAIAALSVLGLIAVLAVAYRARANLRRTGAVLIAGGVLVAPHALPTDLVLVGVALAVWGEAQWFDCLALSEGAMVCAVAPVPVPAVVGVLLTGSLCLRASGAVSFWQRPQPAQDASTG